MNRLQFLRGKYKGESAVRPPWSIAENEFVDTCDRCDACIKACHLKIIQRGSAGFPEMNFSKGGCDFCMACVQNCPTHAIQLTVENRDDPWRIVAQVNGKCLSQRGVVCRACGEAARSRDATGPLFYRDSEHPGSERSLSRALDRRRGLCRPALVPAGTGRRARRP